MAGRIITVRHGRPDLSRDKKISARQYGDWWAAYDRAGLASDQSPPEQLYDLAAEAQTVLSSTLPRAIETAAWATNGNRHVPADEMFVEAPLPPPPVPLIKLRPGTWGVVSRSFWFWGFAPNGIENHRQAWERVAQICERLGAIAKDGDVMLCAHGYLNWMIDRRMPKHGWRRTARHGANNYWSWRIYETAEANVTPASRDKLAAE